MTVSPPSGTVTVVATAKGPGAATVFRGTAASPDPQGAQTLVTGGEPIALTATARLEVTPPLTTVPVTTVPVTMVPETTTTVTTTTTTVPTTTTTVPTTTTTTTTVPETTTTTTIPEATTTTALPIVPITPITVQQLVSLPRTGGGGDGAVAYVATAMLVGGIGLLGTLRRRGLLAYTHEGDAG